MYVAVTRAKKQVFVNRDILEILGVAGEHRMYFKPPAEDKEVCITVYDTYMSF